MFPSGNATGASFVTEAIEQLSKVVGFPKTTFVAVQLVFAIKERFAGATIVGNVTSLTVTVCVADAVLPLPSVTVHVTVVVPNGNTVGALFVICATEQLSAVIGVPSTTLNAAQALLASTSTSIGAVIVGLILSRTVIICVAVFTFPLPSVTVHVTVVVPKANVAGASFVIEATEQLSAVTGVPKTTPVAIQLAFAFKVIFAGAVIEGKVTSVTVTNCVAV